MLVFNFLRVLLLLLLPASISAAAMDRIVYTPGHTNNTSPLVRQDEITWGPDDETQDACDADDNVQKTDGTEMVMIDCWEIIKFNQKPGRYTISGYTGGKWAKISVKDTCTVAVARRDASVNDFEVGDKDIRDWIFAAIRLSENDGDILIMQPVTCQADCDAADTTGNDVPIKWTVADPFGLD